jgi:hypothetical protein
MLRPASLPFGFSFSGRRAYDRPVVRAVVLATTSLVVALPAGSSDAAASESVTIRVIETPVTQSISKDVPPRTARSLGRFTKGDAVSETAILQDVVPQFGWPKGATAGSLSRVIVALSPRTVRDESVAKFLRGTVHVRGESKAVPPDHGVGFHHVFSKPFVVVLREHRKLPIVGGTGIYAGATGVVESRFLYYTNLGAAWLNIYRLQLP